ncbi:hypothetical protein RR48_01067 [Papilio machaon]|uniref:Uncharacterized protein n=1 Tax=Papilio machaon TaxID=76193 RepID=A0A0N1ICK5_PAPMA|nr:hypothetical protein RR48_01067 [Papilio machaon]
MNGNAVRVLAIYFLWKKRQQKRRRTVGVDPYNATRLLRGEHVTSFSDLRENSYKLLLDPYRCDSFCTQQYLTARLNGVRLKRTMAVEAHERRALRPRRANRTRSTNGAAQAREFETLLIPQYISERARSDGAAETRDCKISLCVLPEYAQP